MEIQQLRHLLAAVQHGNLLKAADESYITQSGLSRSIKSLEDRLGVPLLTRQPKGVEPTIYGDSLIRRAKLILNEVARAVEELRAIEEARLGDISFGITQNYASYVVPDILASVARERPDMGITVKTGGFLELIGLVKSEAIDFGFGVIGSLHHDEGIVIEPLSAHLSCVVARVQHPLAGKRDISVQDLAEARWLMLDSEALQRGFASFFDAHGFATPRQMIKTNSLTLIRRVTIQNDVLTVLPKEAVQKKVDQGILTELDCPPPADPSRIGLFYRQGGMMSPQASFLTDQFRAEFGRSTITKKPRPRHVPTTY